MGDGEMSGNGKSVLMLGKSDRIVEGNTSQIGRLEPIFQPLLGLCNRFRDRGRWVKINHKFQSTESLM